MPLLLPPGFRALDASGDPVSGAKLNVYAAGTSTPSSLYSDADLSVAISNPPSFDSSGAQQTAIYVAVGSYKIDLTTSADVSLPGYPIDNVRTVESGFDNLTATRKPTVNDDSDDGYAVNSRWIDVTNDLAYVCVDASPGAAVWLLDSEKEGGETIGLGVGVSTDFTDDTAWEIESSSGMTVRDRTYSADTYLFDSPYVVEFAGSASDGTQFLAAENNGNFPAMIGASYRVTVPIYATGSPNDTLKWDIHWFNSAGAAVSTSTDNEISNSDITSGQVLISSAIVTAPATAVRGRPRVWRVGTDISGTWFCGAPRVELIHALSTALPPGFGYGCTLSNDSDAAHDILISTGKWRDAADSVNIVVSSAFTKRIDATWAAGDDAGGMEDGDTVGNNEWFHVHLLSSADGATVDAGFDTSVTATNLLADTAVVAAGLTNYRRIGSVLTDGSANILAFTQIGDWFFWTDPPLDVNTQQPGTSGTAYALSVPPGVNSRVKINYVLSGGSGGDLYYIRELQNNDEAPSATVEPLVTDIQNASSAAGSWIGMTNTSKQIFVRCSNASSAIEIATLSWQDRRGRDS